MITTTTVVRSSDLAYDRHVNGWFDHVAVGDYTGERQRNLVGALFAAQVDEFNSKLPEGCTWYPALSEIIGPVGTVFSDDWDISGRMNEAVAAVVARFEDIEAKVVGS